MKAEAVQHLLQVMGCRQIRVSGNKVIATCPFEQEHSKGKDSTPSFVVFANAESESTWLCSFPHASDDMKSGGMGKLVRTYARANGLPYSSVPWGEWVDNGNSLHALLSFVWRLDRGRPLSDTDKVKMRLDKTRWQRYRSSVSDLWTEEWDPASAPAPAVSPDYMDQFEYPVGESLRYLLEDRGLTAETIRHWGLKYSPRMERLVIPYFDMTDTLVGITRRAMAWHQEKYWHLKGFRTGFYLYGESAKSRRPKANGKNRGIIVEGQFDVMRLWQMGYRNVVAMSSSSLTKYQLQKCHWMFNSVLIVTDGDPAGRAAGVKVKERLALTKIPSQIVEIPSDMDPGDLEFTREMARELLGVPDVDIDVDKGLFPWEK